MWLNVWHIKLWEQFVYTEEFKLSTSRLVLTLPYKGDFDDLFFLRANQQVMRYVGDNAILDDASKVMVQSRAQVKNHIDLAWPYFKKHGLGFFCVSLKSTGEFIGQCGLFHLGFDVSSPHIELAYRLLPQHWGQGYATEAAIALIEWGFKMRQLSRVIGLAHPSNKASIRVMEKVGMKACGLMEYKHFLLPCFELMAT